MAGIYLHIPFCVRKCAYCDFVSFPESRVPEAYVDALTAEIALVAREGDYPATFDTVFFGGGTPSLLSGEQMRTNHGRAYVRILTSVRMRSAPWR